MCFVKDVAALKPLRTWPMCLSLRERQWRYSWASVVSRVTVGKLAATDVLLNRLLFVFATAVVLVAAVMLSYVPVPALDVQVVAAAGAADVVTMTFGMDCVEQGSSK